MPKRIFDMAMEGATCSSGPASGSHHDHRKYGGSLRWKWRFEYSVGSKSALVELHPSIEEFKDVLRKVPGITEVVWQTTKASEGNVGDHWSEKNVFVCSSIEQGSASSPIEFELTRNMHIVDKMAPFTLTAMFKDPPARLIPEAWRISLHATDGKQ